MPDEVFEHDDKGLKAFAFGFTLLSTGEWRPEKVCRTDSHLLGPLAGRVPSFHSDRICSDLSCES